jgi:hypothetical protein
VLSWVFFRRNEREFRRPADFLVGDINQVIEYNLTMSNIKEYQIETTLTNE